MEPEQKARLEIDRQLASAGWIVQDHKAMNLVAGSGIAVREFPLETGPVDYLLYAGGKVIGVVEAKPEGHPLKGVEIQSRKYTLGVPAHLPAWRRPPPFAYESTGAVTQFTNGLEPDARSREVFTFHRPEKLVRLANMEVQVRARLRKMPPLLPEGLWPVQRQTVENLEQSFARGKPRALIQMATGSGKTHTAAAFCERLIRFGGAKRILTERRKKWEEAQIKKYAEKKQASPKGWKEKYPEPVKPGVAGLPELPEGWCWATLDQLAEIGTGATPLRSETRYWAGGSIPWVTSAVVNAPFVREASQLVTASALEETNLFMYPVNTLVLAMYGEGKTRGKVSELLFEATTNQALAALVFLGSSSACRPYVKTFLAKSYEDMRRVASGGVQPNLNLGLIREIRVPLPPSDEQAEISMAIERLLSVQERLVQESEKSAIRSSHLRQSILKRAFEGKLVPQDPKDEPAGELLARIRAGRVAGKGLIGREKGAQKIRKKIRTKTT